MSDAGRDAGRGAGGRDRRPAQRRSPGLGAGRPGIHIGRMPATHVTRAVLATALVGLALGAGVARASAQVHRGAPARPLRADSTGHYTEEQAARGRAVFTAVCMECHEVEDLTNADFRLEWNGKSLYALYELVRTTMPDENPGTLPREQYVDVIAYMLKINRLPAGSVEFTGDSASASAVVLQLP